MPIDIERYLRIQAKHGARWQQWPALMREAADEIRKQRQEVERLRKKLWKVK
jgi:hypothetical protein